MWLYPRICIENDMALCLSQIYSEKNLEENSTVILFVKENCL